MIEEDAFRENVDSLYSNFRQKNSAVSYFAKIVENHANLKVFLYNESVLLVLCRIVTEEWQKSADTALTCLWIFEQFAQYTYFHKRLVKECVNEMEKAVEENESSGRQELLQRGGSKVKKQLEKMHLKYCLLCKACFRILIYASEHPHSESRVLNNELLSPMITLLSESKDREVISLALELAVKLSVYEESKEKMIQLGIVTTLSTSSSSLFASHRDLVTTCTLLHNLSFDWKAREEIGKSACLVNLIHTMDVLEENEACLGVFYHLSCDAYTIQYLNNTSFLNKTFLMMPSMLPAQSHMRFWSLLVNLFSNDAIAKGIFTFKKNVDVLKSLMEHMKSAQSPVIAKALCNLSFHMPDLFAQEGNALYEALTKVTNPEYIVEVIGILSNLSRDALNETEPFCTKLIAWLIRKLQHLSRKKEEVHYEELLLSLLSCLSSQVCTAAHIEIICQCKVMPKIISHLKVVHLEEEFLYQFLYLLYRALRLNEDIFLSFNDTSEFFDVIEHSLFSENECIQELGIEVANLTQMSNFCKESYDLTAKCQQMKFAIYNSPWIKAIHPS